MKKQIEIKFNVNALPAPTVPVTSWAESRADFKRGPSVDGPTKAIEYFKKYIGGKTTESFLCMYLDHRNHILDVVLEGEGTIDQTVVYPRQVLKRALDLGASSLLFRP